MKITKRDRFGRLIEEDRYFQCETCRNHSRSPDENCYRCINGSNYIPYDVELRSLIGQYYPTTSTPQIKNVILNPPATIVFWADGTKTVVKAYREPFVPEKGLAMAIAKKVLGTGYYPEIKKWTKGYEEEAAKQALRNFENSMRRVPEVMANQGGDE